MKPTSEILERIAKSSTEHKNGVFTRLYRYLLREDIYYAAYQKLYANRGATTKGIDDDTADGFSANYIEKLIHELKMELIGQIQSDVSIFQRKMEKCVRLEFHHLGTNSCKK